jgi:hypothetical protein
MRAGRPEEHCEIRKIPSAVLVVDTNQQRMKPRVAIIFQRASRKDIFFW